MNPSESLNPMAPSLGPGSGARVRRTAPVAALWVARFVALGVAGGSELRTQPPLDIVPSLLDTVGSDQVGTYGSERDTASGGLVHLAEQTPETLEGLRRNFAGKWSPCDHAESGNPVVDEHVQRELKAHGYMRWAGESQRRRTQCQG